MNKKTRCVGDKKYDDVELDEKCCCDGSDGKKGNGTWCDYLVTDKSGNKINYSGRKVCCLPLPGRQESAASEFNYNYMCNGKTTD